MLRTPHREQTINIMWKSKKKILFIVKLEMQTIPNRAIKHNKREPGISMYQTEGVIKLDRKTGNISKT